MMPAAMGNTTISQNEWESLGIRGLVGLSRSLRAKALLVTENQWRCCRTPLYPDCHRIDTLDDSCDESECQ
jgi:hypothetical protein